MLGSLIRRSLFGPVILAPLVFGLALLQGGCGGGDTESNSTDTSSLGVGATDSDLDAMNPFEGLDGVGRGMNRTKIITIEQDEPSPFRFEDVADSAGIDFLQVSGMTPEKYFPTANGSGLAMFDYDLDGDLDLYLLSNCHLPLGTKEPPLSRLYRNMLVETGQLQFEDVTESSGLIFAGFAIGAVAGDLNGDRYPEVYLGTYGEERLFINNGDGTFRDGSEEVGGLENVWSSGGALFDYDLDGDLDLYVAVYGIWDMDVHNERFCGDRKRNLRLYCSPRHIPHDRHLFYHNNYQETGRLELIERGEEAGLARLLDADGLDVGGHGFGVVTPDINRDGYPDIYVANDQDPNFLFINNGDGTFADETELSGAAFDDNGNSQSGMGAWATDVNGDGLVDLFCTNFQEEYNTLYIETFRNDIWMYQDQTRFFNLSAPSMPWVGWGCALLDFDCDGWVDCFVTNGHVDDNRSQIIEGEKFEAPPLLCLSTPTSSGRRFELSTRDVGPYFEEEHVGRGAAFGDLDNDGDYDIVVSHVDDQPAVLINNTPHKNHWVRLDVRPTRSNLYALGAKVVFELEDPTQQDPVVIHREILGGGSMFVTNDYRLLVGLGRANSIARLTMTWPSGAVTELTDLPVDGEIVIEEPSEIAGQDDRPADPITTEAGASTN